MSRQFQAVLLAVVLTMIAPFAMAQEPSLEDIRKDIDRLAVQMQDLKTQLLATGNAGVAPDDVGPFLQRLNTLEAELSKALGRVETLENRIRKITEDAETRIGDLEFRLTELEGGDTSALGKVTPLGGPQAAPTDAPELATDEQRSFNAAMALLEAGDNTGAAQAFADFITTYPGGPLTSEAQYRRGLALAAAGDWGGAARSFLDSFSGAPDGPFAPLSLLELASSLGQLGQTEQACLTFDEIAIRYPEKGAELADRIATRKQQVSCP